MLIYADVRCLQDPAYAGRGIGSHAAFLLRALRRHGPSGTVIVGCADPALNPLPVDAARLCDEVQSACVTRRPGQPAVFLQLSPLTHDSRWPARLFDRPDVLSCAVVYDFIQAADPERYLAVPAARLAHVAALRWLDAARVFFPISAGVAAELGARLDVPAERIVVTGVALRPAFADVFAGRWTPPRPRDAPGRYCLFSGGPDVRKNLETVVDALLLGGQGSADAPRALVVAGAYPASWRRRVLRRLRRAAVEIRFLDHVDDRELAAWYRHAECTVVASLAEGFSLPVIEAQACGTPALVSDIPAHRELVTDAAARFPATSAATLAELIARAARPEGRNELLAAQADTPARFLPDAVGERFAVALETHWAAHWRRCRSPRPSQRPRVALLTPFPPDQSGIAEYSLGTVAALARHVDVDVYTDQPRPVAAPVRRFHPLTAAAHLRPDYDAVVSVIGNSHFHARTLDIHAALGGACILHDSRLADLYAWWHGDSRAAAVAAAELGRPLSARDVRRWLADPGRLPALFLAEVARAAAPLMVHSEPLRGEVRRRYGVDAVHLPFCVQRPFTAAELGPGPRRRSREALGMPDGRIVIVSLGLLAATKAPAVCIDALAAVRRAGFDAHLYFVGDCRRAGPGVRRHAEARGCGVAVHLTPDWLSEADYRAHLAAADVAIQLRTHGFGGLSGALIDCIASGLPTVANDDLAGALGAPTFVRRVGDELRADDVAAVLAGLLHDGPAGVRDEPSRLRYLGERSFARYAVKLLAALGLEATPDAADCG